jgi:sulfatase modifying factor 1
MRREKEMKPRRVPLSLILCVFALIVAGCTEAFGSFSNPIDSKSSSYQGFETVKDAASIAIASTRASPFSATLVATAVYRADGYKFQIATDAAFVSIVFDPESSSNSLSWDPAAERTYYWRVKARVDGNWGADWSASSGSFSAAPGWNPAPIDAATIDDTTPLLDWPDVAEASVYELQLATTSGGVATATAVTTTSSQHQVSPGLSKGSYYWRVRAGSAAGDWTAWSSIWSLTIDPPKLVEPLMISLAAPVGGVNASFYMGSTSGEFTDETYHRVWLSPFRMSKYEISQSIYQSVMGTNPSRYSSNTDAASCPVEQVTWYDAVEFCNKLSEVEGLQPVYTITGRTPYSGYPITAAAVEGDWTKSGYRLPTEAQWEYAGRGGANNTYPWGNSNQDEIVENYAWYGANSSIQGIPTTHGVGTKLANYYGLFDMAGNVSEWCWDWYSGAYQTGEPVDPLGASSGTLRVRRGGGWGVITNALRVSDRDTWQPGSSRDSIGFRVVAPPLP